MWRAVHCLKLTSQCGGNLAHSSPSDGLPEVASNIVNSVIFTIYFHLTVEKAARVDHDFFFV